MQLKVYFDMPYTIYSVLTFIFGWSSQKDLLFGSNKNGAW